MPPEADTSSGADATGVSALILLLRFHGIAVDAKRLTHQYGRSIGITEMLRCAKDLKLKARAIDSDWERLVRTTFPAIAERRDGSFLIISRVADNAALILDPAEGARSRLIALDWRPRGADGSC